MTLVILTKSYLYVVKIKAFFSSTNGTTSTTASYRRTQTKNFVKFSESGIFHRIFLLLILSDWIDPCQCTLLCWWILRTFEASLFSPLLKKAILFNKKSYTLKIFLLSLFSLLLFLVLCVFCFFMYSAFFHISMGFNMCQLKITRRNRAVSYHLLSM